jgi:rubrerythrin
MNEETRANVMLALHGEAFAHARYRAFARAARESGNRDLAETLEGVACVELDEHFAELAELVGLAGADDDNLGCAIHDESEEVEVTYRLFAEQARSAGDDVVADRFDEIREDELAHLRALEGMLERLEVPT